MVLSLLNSFELMQKRGKLLTVAWDGEESTWHQLSLFFSSSLAQSIGVGQNELRG